MSVRSILIVLNVAAVVAFLVIVVLIARRAEEPRAPSNLEPFLPDEDLEGRRLDRVLGWALICAAVFAVALPLYWLREPVRQDESIDYFDENEIERGAVLFAAAGDENYNGAVSLGCAGCHGSTGAGGSTNAVFTDPENGEVAQVVWAAPALDTVLLRYDEEEVTEVLNYGRPGTPMAAFGTPGGGPKNAQSISDLVAYLRSIQLTPAQAQARSDEQLETWRTQPETLLEDAEAALAEAETALEQARADAEAAAIADAEAAVEARERGLAWARDWSARRQGVSDGQLLYELNCARCHTPGWSVFDPNTDPTNRDRPWPPDIVLGEAGGGGVLGFSLRDGAPERRFGPGDEDSEAFAAHAEFIAAGSERNVPYGIGGIGNGRMPGFGDLLTDEQIAAIVEYERGDLSVNDPSVPVSDEE